MDPKVSDESDNEGFVPNQIKIDSHDIRQDQISQPKHKDFEPHYIFGEGLLRKQPPEAIQSFITIPMKPRCAPRKNIDSDNKDQLPTVHQLLGNKNKYTLLYQRFKQPFGYGSRNLFQNQLKLNCCQNYNQQNFRMLREWDGKNLQQLDPNNNDLVFDSRFEGGNLRCAFKSKKQPNTYILFMQNDTNTYGYNQWFYFSIRNAKIRNKYTFRIANFKKNYSFFNEGMQPTIFSLSKAKKQGNGWYRDGSDLSYHASNYHQPQGSPYYTLQFSLQFEHQNDYITISPYAPYSYSKLMLSLKKNEKIALKNNLSWRLKSIADSIAYNQVPYLIISNKANRKKQKKKILILARQHSGQTWSSFLIQQMITYLVTQQTTEAKWLLQQFDFHIFPMINVDGVIYGNFRCDLAGNDLNRCWKSPLQSLQPQVYHIKREIVRLSENQSIEMCLDLHTHGRDYGAFAYCCVDSKQCRELPNLFQKCVPIFRYGACTFGISGEKQFTARAAVFGLTNSINTVTIELSAYGFKHIGRRYAVPFTPKHIKYIAFGVFRGYYAYKNNIENPAQVLQPEFELQKNKQSNEDIQTFQDREIDISKVDIPVQGSDSEPEIDLIELQIKINNIYPTRFIQDITQQKGNKNSKKNIKKHKKLSKELNIWKIQNKPQSKLKMTKSQVKQQSRTQKAQSLNPPTISYESRQQNSPQSQNIRKPTFSIQNQNLYKKQNKIASENSHKLQIEKSAKPLNLVQFSLKKLPICPPEKISQNQSNYHILLDQGSPLLGAFSYGKRQQNRFDKTFSTYEAMCRPRVRIQNKKIGIARQNSRLQQQLPFLCIMSQNKKQVQIQKMKQRKQGKSLDKKLEVKYIINGHRPQENTIVRFRDKQKQIQLIAKIGMDHYTRYAQNCFIKRP